MRQFLLTCSKDAVDIDFQIAIYAKHEPGFWRCYDIADRHGCEWFTLEEYLPDEDDYEEYIF